MIDNVFQAKKNELKLQMSPGKSANEMNQFEKLHCLNSLKQHVN